MIVLQLAFCIIVHGLIAFCAPEAWCCRRILVLIGDLCSISGKANAAFLPPVGCLHMQVLLGNLNASGSQSLMSIC